MIITRALKDDIAYLCEIEKEYPDYSAWGENGFTAEFNKPFSVTLVAREEKIPAAFLNFWLIRPRTEINTLVTSIKYLRRGFARALLSKCFEYARKNDCPELFLEVAQNNKPAIELYLSCGFSEISRRSKYYNNTYDAIVMAKRMAV
ncbi:MAG: hypothetical protein Fur0012_04460 [Elusimicrobiota bacterium]